MIIHKPQIQSKGDHVKIIYPIVTNDFEDNIWFKIEKKYKSFLDLECLDAPLLGILFFALKRGEDIRLEGGVSEGLMHNLNIHFFKIAKLVVTDIKSIKIHAKQLVNRSCSNDGFVITGFSGGIDSFCTLYNYYYNCKYPSFKITHLLFNNVGSHGKDLDKSRVLFNERFKLLEPAIQEIGLQVIKVDTNLHKYCDFDFINLHEVLNAAVGFLLKRRIDKYLYSSAYSYQACFKGKQDDLAYFDPSVLPLLSISNFKIIPVGSEYTRVEKTRLVSKLAISNKYLNVCVSDGVNCSICYKCLRTLFTLDLLGILHSFNDVFDLEKYHQVKWWYAAKIFANKKEVLNAEIIEEAKIQGYKFPFQTLVKGHIFRFLNLIRNWTRLKQ